MFMLATSSRSTETKVWKDQDFDLLCCGTEEITIVAFMKLCMSAPICFGAISWSRLQSTLSVLDYCTSKSAQYWQK